MLMASWSRVAYGHSVRSARSVDMVGRSRVGPQSTHGHSIWGLWGDLVPGSMVPPCQPIFCFTGIVMRKNSSILERCVILIYYVVEIRIFKV